MPPRTFTETQIRTAQRALSALEEIAADQKVALAGMERSLELLDEQLNAPTFNKAKAKSSLKRVRALQVDMSSKMKTADRNQRAMRELL